MARYGMTSREVEGSSTLTVFFRTNGGRGNLHLDRYFFLTVHLSSLFQVGVLRERQGEQLFSTCTTRREANTRTHADTAAVSAMSKAHARHGRGGGCSVCHP